MTNEAFSRVKIDAQLRDQSWEIENPSAVRFGICSVTALERTMCYAIGSVTRWR